TAKAATSLEESIDGGKLELRRVLAHEKAPGVGWVSNFWGALHQLGLTETPCCLHREQARSHPDRVPTFDPISIAQKCLP
ncbi:hypothetical protein, partial [Pseudomonas proteolytica]|uniref:hypothetical protein n=1 Tax=Pseudomonas proteolytica TaxID=219574 RepID=UPI001CB72B0E